MRKRNLIIALLPLIAGVTIAGTGFATWHFQSSVNPSTNSATVYVTGKEVAGASLTLSGPAQLNLDDPQYGNGLRWMKDSDVEDTFTASITESTTSSDEKVTASTTMDAKLEIAFPSNLMTYVQVNSISYSKNLTTSNSGTAGEVGTTLFDTVNNKVTLELTGLQVATQTITLDLSGLVSYTTTVVTTAGTTGTRASSFTQSTYDTMKNALTSSSITFTFSISFATSASA